MKQRAPFPPIADDEVTRLPRSTSNGTDRDSGRCLIAISKGERVLVRNCYTGEREPIVVENMSAHVKRAARGSGVAMTRLAREGFKIVRGPFMVAHPCPGLQLSLDPLDFEAHWQNNRLGAPNYFKLYYFRPSETPTLITIRSHWRARRVREDWTPERIKRVCRLWSVTPHELAELIQWRPGWMEMHVNGKNSHPLPGPVAVWLYFLENVRLGVPIFPDLQTELKAS